MENVTGSVLAKPLTVALASISHRVSQAYETKVDVAEPTELFWPRQGVAKDVAHDDLHHNDDADQAACDDQDSFFQMKV